MGAIYQFHYQLSRFLARTLFDFQVVHGDRILEHGGVILAMNHESYLDPPLVGIACQREIYYLARKTLLDVPLLGVMLPHLNVIPVDQEKADMSALKTVIKVVRAGQATVIFPEGTRTLDGRIQGAQPGLGLVIAKTQAPVVPMRIFGAHRAFPSGGKPRVFNPIKIVVGHPIHFSRADVSGDGRAFYQGLSQRVMDEIESIEAEG